jgi:hypothetical protein
MGSLYQLLPTILKLPVSGKVMEVFQIVMRPGAFLVDRVPILYYFPGYGKQLTEWHRQELGLYSHQLGRVKSEVVRTFQ